MSTFISFRQLCNILDHKRMPLVYANRQNVRPLGRRDSRKVPYHFPTFRALRLVYSDTNCKTNPKKMLPGSDVFRPYQVHQAMFSGSRLEQF